MSDRTSEVLGGLFILENVAILAAWHWPAVLRWMEAKVRARRIGMRAQGEAFAEHSMVLELER